MYAGDFSEMYLLKKLVYGIVLMANGELHVDKLLLAKKYNRPKRCYNI